MIVSDATVGEEDTKALSTVTPTPDLRVRHLVNILSTPSDTESDMVETALRDDRQDCGVNEFLSLSRLKAWLRSSDTDHLGYTVGKEFDHG